MSATFDRLATERDSYARCAARALMDGDNAAALRFAARYDRAERDILDYLKEVTS